MFVCTLITTVCTVLLLVLAYLTFRRERQVDRDYIGRHRQMLRGSHNLLALLCIREDVLFELGENFVPSAVFPIDFYPHTGYNEYGANEHTICPNRFAGL